MTPSFDGSKLAVSEHRSSTATAIFGSRTNGNGIFRIHGNVVEHYGRTDGLSSDAVVRLYLKTEKGLFGLRLRTESTTFAIRASPPSRASKDWGTMHAVGVLASRDGTIWVANAWFSRSHLERERLLHSQWRMVFPVIKSPPCWKTAPGICG